MAGNTSVPGATVGSRLLAVLDCFDVDHRELTLTEIAQRADLPLSTARRLITELTEWGGLERLSSGGYRIGVRLWQVGSLAPQARNLREAALPHMHDLFEATRENVQLAVLDGLEALCLEKITGTKSVPTVTHVGGRLPLHTTGVGKVLLAFSPPHTAGNRCGTGARTQHHPLHHGTGASRIGVGTRPADRARLLIRGDDARRDLGRQPNHPRRQVVRGCEHRDTLGHASGQTGPRGAHGGAGHLAQPALTQRVRESSRVTEEVGHPAHLRVGHL